jgi:hypothetical protein
MSTAACYLTHRDRDTFSIARGPPERVSMALSKLWFGFADDVRPKPSGHLPLLTCWRSEIATFQRLSRTVRADALFH